MVYGEFVPSLHAKYKSNDGSINLSVDARKKVNDQRIEWSLILQMYKVKEEVETIV